MLPAGADASAWLLLVGRGLRGFCDGFVAVLLPAYLLALGFSQLDVGLVSSATLVGSAVATMLVGMFAGRHPLRRMRVLSSFDVGKDPDVLAYDPGLHLLYVAGEAGIVSMFHVDSGKVTKIGDGHIGPNAHVVVVDDLTHRSYYPLKNLHGQATLRVMEPRAEATSAP